MKTKTRESEPPASGGGMNAAPETLNEHTTLLSANALVDPPANAGGSDLTAENEQLKETLRTERAHRQITGELAQAGARSPELLFDAVKGELQFDDEDRLANAAAIIGKLMASFPEQFGTPSPPSIDAGAGRTVSPPLTREALRRMKPAEIAALDWNDVRRVLASN